MILGSMCMVDARLQGYFTLAWIYDFFQTVVSRHHQILPQLAFLYRVVLYSLFSFLSAQKMHGIYKKDGRRTPDIDAAHHIYLTLIF